MKMTSDTPLPLTSILKTAMKFYSNNHFLFLLLLFLFITFQRNLATVISCEGFIKSNVTIDLTKVQIKLYTIQGNLKHETECNPQNGYFLIPIYKQGKYLIKLMAPDGWIFAPEFREIEITDDNNDCSGELNFNLSGFKITGKVSGNTSSNLILGLYNKEGDLIKKTTIDQSGYYSFDANSGKYIISPINGSAQCVNKGSIEIEVTNSPVDVKPDIKIAGQNLLVKVYDELKSPLSGVTIILHSENKIEFDNLPINVKLPKVINEGNQWMHSMETAESGTVLFYCLPIGSYAIAAKMTKSNTDFNFETKNLEMNSKPKQVEIELKSFNLTGYVLNRQSEGIEGAYIFLNGAIKSESNKDGIFSLNNVKPGRLEIVVKKEHYEFDKLRIELSSKFDARLEIKPEKIAICGMIYPFVQKEPIDFQITDNHTVDDFSTDLKGKFCRLLKPGKYIVRPISLISFAPKQIEVNLLENPILNIKFTQFKVSIEGIVKCFGNCINVKLELWQANELIFMQNVNSNGIFKFDKISPSDYILKIIDDLNIWWDVDEQRIEVIDSDLEHITFTQKGYQVEFQTSHPVVLKYWPKENEKKQQKFEQMEFTLIPGNNFLHFTEANIFSFILESCHDFQQLGDATFSVPSKDPIKFRGISSTVSIVVQTNGYNNSTLEILLRDKFSGDLIGVHHILETKVQQVFVFYIPLSQIGSEFQIVPRSNVLLFLPDSSAFTFDGHCNNELIIFKTTVGKFIEGFVIPKVVGVNVIARQLTDSTALTFTTQTDDEGKYRIGPVWNTEDFILEIYKEGYEFHVRPDNSKIFDSVRLSQFIIKFVDSNTKTALSDVLVSISGGANYRSNNVTDSTGMLNFIGLAPGSYYVRPILQEYKFNASSFSVFIKEGQIEEMTLEAKKFAYSVFGKVSTIGSKSIQVPIRVEAVSADCNNHQEEDLFDPKIEKFRIRGLKSKCSYRITLKDADEKHVKSFPPFVVLQIGIEDITNVNFMVLPPEQPTPTLVGQIEMPVNSMHTGNYRVVLSDFENNIIQELTVHNPSSVFFFKLPAYSKEYSVNIYPDGKQTKYEFISSNFVANSSFTYLKFIPKLKLRSNDADVFKSNYYFGFALFLLITIAFLNRTRTKFFVDYLIHAMRTFINNGNLVNIAETDASKKKKIKK